MTSTSEIIRAPGEGRIVWLRPELVAPWWQIVAVVAVFIGPFAGIAGWLGLHGSSTKFVQILLSDRELLLNGALESGLLAVFLALLHWRGWRPADFRIGPSAWSSLQGIGLFLLTELGNFVTVVGLLVLLFTFQSRYASFLAFLSTNVPQLHAHSIDVRWSVLFGSMILNAFFEELIFMGYVFNQLAARLGPGAALLLTVLLRMACHTYQGPLHVLGIGVVFLIYGIWYGRTRNLWTLIFAHAVLDLFSTSALKLIYG